MGYEGYIKWIEGVLEKGTVVIDDYVLYIVIAVAVVWFGIYLWHLAKKDFWEGV